VSDDFSIMSERACAKCGDEVLILSSRDWCDGCEMEDAECRRCHATIDFGLTSTGDWEWHSLRTGSIHCPPGTPGRHYPVNPIVGIDYG
jgi:hypothetical protein